MVFSTATIKSSQSKTFPAIQKESSIDTSKSIFIETLQLILQEDIFIQRSLVDSNSELLSESDLGKELFKTMIKKVDFKKILSNILKWFINILEKIYREFEVFMVSLVNEKSVIKKFKNKLERYDKPIEYISNRYIYTNLGTNTSYTTYKNDLDKEFSTLILDLSKFRNFRSYEELYQSIEDMRNESSLSENYLDELRGFVLGSRNSITKADFPKELYNYFRNDGIVVPSGIIPPEEIRLSCDRFFNYKKIIKSIEKDKSDMKAESSKIQQEISRINLSDFVKDSIPQEAQTMFATVLNNKIARVKNICDLYLQLFSAKLDAAKESQAQTSQVLIEVCKTIVREGE